MMNIEGNREVVRWGLILACASAATLLTLGLLFTVLPSGYPRDFIFNRSLIQYATIALFWITMATLLFKYLDYRNEAAAYRRAAEILSGPEFGQQLIWSHAPDVRERFCQAEDQRYQGTVIFERIVRALERLYSSQSTKAMEDYFRARSDFDATALETAYTGIRYCVWLLPTLGFVGTVMGIGLGLAEFANILPNMEDLQTVRDRLPDVTEKLGTAFDTTLLALLLSVAAVFYMSFVLKRQEELLEKNDGLCFDGVCSRFQEHSTASESIIRAIHDNVEQISERMNGNRGAIEQIIRSEVPALIANGVATPVQSMEKSVTTLLHRVAENLVQVANAHQESQARLAIELRQLRDEQARARAEIKQTLEDLRDTLTKLNEYD